jgi:endo-1,4-beta-xylanase
VNISELDVRIADVTGDHPTKLAIQKQVYHRVIAACMQVAACESVTTWGFTDKHSWIDSTFGADDPLPFDEQYARKPAYFGMVDGFVGVPADAPGTAPNLVGNATFEVGSDGWMIWGGVLGTTMSAAHTGAQSAVVGSRTATWHAAVLDVRALVAPGRRYDVSAFARIDAPSDAVRFTAKSRCAGGTDSFTTLGSGTATDAGWVELAGELSVPTCALDELVVYVEGPAPGVTLYVDDVALRPQPGAAGPNLIANPDFETDAASWFGFGDPVVAATAAQAHGGIQSGHATNRLATWQGPATSILGAAAGAYQASAWVRLTGATAGEVHMTLKTRCAGTDQFVRVGTAFATDTGWAQLTGTLTVQDCAPTELVVYFEGPAAGVDIFVDDVAVTGPP